MSSGVVSAPQRVRTLYVAAATASAATELAAFDRALVAVGAANHNLIRLSSVIPPDSAVSIVARCPSLPGSSWGDRLYVVYAEQRASEPGAAAWAGVGWAQDEHTGRGLFVEHEGQSEAAVRSDIAASLAELQASRELDLGPTSMHVVGTTCTSEPCCALVMCIYASEPWG